MIEAPIDQLRSRLDRLIALIGINTALLLVILALLIQQGASHHSPHPEEAAHAAVSKDAPAVSAASWIILRDAAFRGSSG